MDGLQQSNFCQECRSFINKILEVTVVVNDKFKEIYKEWYNIEL